MGKKEYKVSEIYIVFYASGAILPALCTYEKETISFSKVMWTIVQFLSRVLYIYKSDDGLQIG